MQNDTRTEKKTPRSSLCKKVSFTVPTSWGELTQKQLRYVLSVMFLYGRKTERMEMVKLWALRYFCRFEPIRKTDAGWLCQLIDSKKAFTLNPELIPSMLEQLSWLDHPEEMTVRLEEVSGYKAVDMSFHRLPFKLYLELENYYQYFLATEDGKYLEKMFRILYSVPTGLETSMAQYIPLSVFLWYTATKHTFSKVFHHFLKPVREGQQTGTQESQLEMMNAQIRLLTKGDITKNNEVLLSSTWDALTELDALARDSEEFNRKYGKHGT